MKSRGIRVLLVMLAIAALAAAGLIVWHFEQRVAAERSAADTFERDARQAVISLGELAAAQQACVAEGQATQPWLAKVKDLSGAIGPKLAALHQAAGTVEAQSAMESAIEAFATFGQSDAKARDYLKSSQQLSASDVIFTDGAAALEKVVSGIDSARGRESVARAVAVANARPWELGALGAGLLLTLLVLLLLIPIPRAVATEADDEKDTTAKPAGGLGLSYDMGGDARRVGPAVKPARTVTPAPTPVPEAAGRGNTPAAIDVGGARLTATVPDPAAVADVCSYMARMQDSRELQGLLERIAQALDAPGVIVWMPDTAQVVLRPALTCGYSPVALLRMGAVQPMADNATAAAFRTKTVMVVPADELSNGAVVAPLVTAEGCSGAMAVELRDGVEVTAHVRAMITIVAAQLATLLTPIPAPAPAATPTPSSGSATRKP